MVEGLREITVAEFLITSIAADDKSPLVRTTIRYDIVGAGTKAWRVERVGVWRMSWRRAASGWRVVEWTVRFAAHEPSQCSDLQRCHRRGSRKQ